MNVYFIEAIDGAGKTTIAEEVGRRLNITTSRLPYYENETGRLVKEAIKNKSQYTESEFQTLMMNNYEETLRDLKEQGLQDVIITRGVGSMKAYSYYFTRNNKSERKKCDEVIKNTDIVIDSICDNVYNMFINSTVDECMPRILARGNVEEVFENTSVLNYVYDVFASMKSSCVFRNKPGELGKTFNDVERFILLSGKLNGEESLTL